MADITYGQLFGGNGIIGEEGKIITADTVLEVATIDESINGDGGLTLGWNSTTGGGIPVGTTVGGFVLIEPYIPTKNGDGSYRYEVKFSDPVALLGKRYFMRNVQTLDYDNEGNAKGSIEDIPLLTFGVTCSPETIIGELATAGECSCEIHSGVPQSVKSFSFDGDTIKSAAQKIADACGVSVWFTSGPTIHFGAPDGLQYQSGEYYNTFIVLGGTKNMTKKIVTSEGEEYAAVTKRLSLPSTYAGSKIRISDSAPYMEKVLIFDNIYPKVRMKIKDNPRERRCYLFNDKGEKIQTGVSDGQPVYAKYSKWYITLEDCEGYGHIDQSELESLIIDGQSLRLQFLPFTEGGKSLLAGYEFELVHFATTPQDGEWEEDDVLEPENPFRPVAGEYRIVFNADNSMILPSTSEQGLVPKKGDIVTLVNIAVPKSCYDAAREQLETLGLAAAQAYSNAAPSSYSESGSGTAGSTSGGYMITGTHKDLITGEESVTYGTISQKGMLASAIDKIEGAQSYGGGGTTASSQNAALDGKVGVTSQEQWLALAQAGGFLGVKTLSRRVSEAEKKVTDFGADVTEIQQQADQRMQLWFGTYVPTAANYPANQWASDAEKQLHVEDIFYNYSREALDPNGGKVWRWTKHETETEVEGETVITVTYSWEEVTDAETLLALEKIVDVAYDGKLAGGSEKVRVYTQWMQAVEEHKKYSALHTTYGITTTAYEQVYALLAQMLNGGSFENATNRTNVLSGIVSPAWLANLSATTAILLGSDFIATVNTAYQGWVDANADAETNSRTIYRNLWNEYYKQADALDRSNKATVLSIADDGIISKGAEKGQLFTLWGETLAEFWKYIEQAEDYSLENESGENAYKTYVSAFCSLAWMLNEDTAGNYTTYLVNGKFAKNAQNFPQIFSGLVYPKWISDGTGGTLDEDTAIDADTYRSNWNDYYTARANLLKRIETASKTATDAAQATANSAVALIGDIVADGKLTLDELPDLKREFESAYRERAKMVDMATDNNGELISSSLPLDAYLTAFKTLVTYLQMGQGNWTEPATYTIENGSYTVAAKSPLAPTDFPVLLKTETTVTFLSNWSDSTSADKGAKLRDLWADLTTKQVALANAMASLAKKSADDAQSDATRALAQISAIASDGVLSVTEIPDLKREFETAYRQRAEMVSLATSTHKLKDASLRTPLDGYLAAFTALADYLNMNGHEGNGTWDEPEGGTYTVYNGAGVTDANASYNVVAQQVLAATDFPAILQKTENVTFVANWNANPLVEDGGAAFRNLWATLATCQVKLANAMASLAKDMLDDIANDKKITQGEKNDLLKQWNAWLNEYTVLQTAKDNNTINADTAWTAYQTSFYYLANFLKDLSNSSTAINTATYTPTMLNTAGTTTLTAAQATLYVTVLQNFRTARTALLAQLAVGKMSYWVSPFLPANGFFVGDRCIWKNHLANGTYSDGTDTVMICVKEWDLYYHYYQKEYNSETGQDEDSADASASIEDDSNWFDYWKEASTVIVEPDPRDLLTALADKLYCLYGHLDNSESYFPITVQAQVDSYTEETYLGATTFNGFTVEAEEVVSLLQQLYEMMGGMTFTVNTVEPVTPALYDMLCTPVSCAIPGSYDSSTGQEEVVTGGVQIRMYNGSAWEYVQESTTSLLQSLGDKILAMVFGSEAAATEAAGLSVGQRFAKLFAMAQVWDANYDNGDGTHGAYVTLSQALFGLSINVDSNGKYYSTAQLRADKINFSAGSYSIDASHVTFSLGGSELNLGSNIVELFVNSLGSGDKEELSAAIGMVVRADSGNNSFSFGTYDSNGNWQEGLQFALVNNSGTVTTKLILNGDNVQIGNGFTQLLGITAQSLGITAQSLNITASDVDFTGYTFTVDAANITLAAGNTPSQGFQSAVAACGVVLKSDMAGIGLYDSQNNTFKAGLVLMVDSSTGVPTTTLNLSGNNVTVDASRIVFTDNGVTTAIIENGKIKASLIDVTNLNVLDALTGQTIDMENATFQNLHVTGEVTGIVTAETLLQNLNMGRASDIYKLTMDNDDEVLISETNVATLQGYIGEIYDHVGENEDIPRTVVKIEYYGNKDTDIFYASTNGQRIYVPNPELSEGRTIEVYNGTGGSIILASSAAPPCTSAEDTWGSPRSDLFFYATRTSASAGDLLTNAVYVKIHAGRRVESGSDVEKLYWIILEQRNADGTLYFP